MWGKVIFLMVLLFGTVSVVGGQTTAQIDSHSLLTELGKMLSETPKSEKDCQAILNRIKVWHEVKLKEIKVSKGKLSIIEPKDKSRVPERPYVSGIVTDPNAEVWVIVHPMEVTDYWVQPRVTVKRDGSWKVSIYIGRPGSIDIGKHFEIIAIANPKSKVKEGDVLSGWPDAGWKSEVIEVIRK